ncbi:MAG: ornithine cyclodeaminase family protein, partial [Desulfovibrionales bacterium]
MHTLIITKEHVARVLTPEAANHAVEQAFVAYGLGQVDMPAKSYLNFPKGDLRSMPSYIHGQSLDIAAIKSVTVHPGNRKGGLPTVMAVVVLVDPDTGFPLAIMDGTYLTSMRTGAAGALAAKLLSREQSTTAGFVGSGIQARTQLDCTMRVRPLTRVTVWEHRPGSQTTADFMDWARNAHGLEVTSSPDIDQVTTGVDILVTTTPAEKPLVRRVSPGTHVN